MTHDSVSQTAPSPFWRFFMKVMNPWMKWLLKSPLHGVVSRSYLLVTFTGRKSGKVYTTPVQYTQKDHTVYIITSAGYTWWKNLRGGAPVQLQLRGRAYSARADTDADPQIVREVLAALYPTMTAEQLQQFSTSKVALIVQIMPDL